MKKITTIFSLVVLIGCSTTQSNIKTDSIETFNLGNYNEFNIKINNANMSAEVNPIVLERFKENLKTAIEQRGLKYKSDSEIVFDINFTTKETVESDPLNFYYSRYYYDYYRLIIVILLTKYNEKFTTNNFCIPIKQFYYFS